MKQFFRGRTTAHHEMGLRRGYSSLNAIREGQRKRRESEREVPSYRQQLNLGSIDAGEARRHNHYRFEACTAAGTTLTPHERRFAE